MAEINNNLIYKYDCIKKIHFNIVLLLKRTAALAKIKKRFLNYKENIRMIYHGSGYDDIKLYKSPYRLQTGAGLMIRGTSLGGIFKRFFKYIRPLVQKSMPYVKKGLKTVGNEVLEGGIEMLNDTSQRSFNELFREQSGKRINNLAERAQKKLRENLSGENINRRNRAGRKTVLGSGGLKKHKVVKKKHLNLKSILTAPTIRGLVIKDNKKKKHTRRVKKKKKSPKIKKNTRKVKRKKKNCDKDIENKFSGLYKH